MFVIRKRPTLTVAALLIMMWIFGQHSASAQRSPSMFSSGAVTKNHPDGQLSGPSEAIIVARRVVGIGEEVSTTETAELVVEHTDKTPFLSEQVNGRSIWRVVIQDFPVRLDSAPNGATDQFRMTLEVFLDPKDGRLLKALTRWPEDVPLIYPEPRAHVAAEQMRQAGDEQYVAFPSVVPTIDLMDALNVVFQEGGNVLVAKQIGAVYVLWSRMGREPRAVWAITLRGIPPIEPVRPEDRQLGNVYHMRWIVDAQTGKWLFASTTPRPERPEADALIRSER